jgi:acyl transferase domain-containing protein
VIAGLVHFGTCLTGTQGNQAAVLVKEAPAFDRPQSIDTRTCHVIALSAKTQGSLDTIRAKYAQWLEHAPEGRICLSDLGITTTARRIHYPHRLAVVAGSVDELARQLKHILPPASSPSADSRKVIPGIGLCFPHVPEASCARPEFQTSSPTFASAFSKVLAFTVRAGFADPRKPDAPNSAAVRAFAGQHALAQLVLSAGLGTKVTGISFSGQGVFAALLSAGACELVDAVELVNVAAETPERLGDFVDAIDWKVPVKPLLDVNGQQIDVAGDRQRLRSLILDSAHLISKASADLSTPTPALGDQSLPTWLILGEQEIPSPSGLPLLERGKDGWHTLCQMLTTLHLGGHEVDWLAWHRDFISGARVVDEAPTYAFELTRHWMEYQDRTLLVPYPDDDDALSDTVSDEEEVEEEKALRVPPYALLGRCVCEPDVSRGGRGAVYETPLHSAPFAQLVGGHRVHGKGIVSATQWAEMALEFAHDAADAVLGHEESAKLSFQVDDVEIVSPLLLHDPSFGHVTIVSEEPISSGVQDPVGGLLESGSQGVRIRFQSRAAGSEETHTHLTCSVRRTADDEANWRKDWRAEAPLVRSRIADMPKDSSTLSNRMAYKMFQVAVDYEPAYQGYVNIFPAFALSMD